MNENEKMRKLAALIPAMSNGAFLARYGDAESVRVITEAGAEDLSPDEVVPGDVVEVFLRSGKTQRYQIELDPVLD